MKNLKRILLIGMVLTMFTACGKKNPTVSDNAADPTYVAPIVSINNTVSEPEATPATPVSVVETTISEDEPIEPVNDAGLHHVEIATLADQRDQLLSEASTLAVMEQVYDYNKQIAELNNYDFTDMKITCLGDSITYGLGGKTNEYGNQVSYADYLGDILGCEIVKLGVPGSAIGNYGSDTSFLYRVKEIPEDTDIIIVFGGINDYLCGNSVFGSEEVKDGKYYGDVEKLFKDIREAFPDTPMFVVLNYQTALEDMDELKDVYSLDMWLDVQRSYATQYDFYKIEMYRNGFMNSKVPEIRSALFYDEIHPNDSGYLAIARYIAAKIIQVYN